MLALAAAGVIIVVCGAVLGVLFLVRDVPSSDADSVSSGFPFGAGAESATETEIYTETETYTEPETSEQSTTDESTANPLSGFQQVSGPGGMTTRIPDGWPTKTATGPGAMQVDDPTGASIVLRYGGSVTSEVDTYQIHTDYEQEFSANRSGYSRFRLDQSTVRGMSAVDWEFEYDPQNDVRRHVRSVYWLSQGYEYFVYASAPVDQWFRAQEILDVMLENATP